MSVPRILLGGAYVAPELYAVMMELYTELFDRHLGDLEDDLLQALFSDSRIAERVRVGWTMHRWELTPFGARILHQLLVDVTSPGLTERARRAAIAQTLALAAPTGRPS